jgi:alginate O-acetyltransferase complex protein AlgI
MAVGLAMLVGFRFPENFNRPYLATSVTEFWRRWHISLSRWMRDYLYIPLGGNRVSPLRQRINLWTVFLLSGFWHGASWNFLLWGAYHGLFLAIEKSPTSERFHRLPVVIRRAATLLIVMFGWVLFRSESVKDAVLLMSVLLGISGSFAPAPPAIARASIISDVGLALLLGATLWCLVIEPLLERLPQQEGKREPLLFRYPVLSPVVVVLFVVAVLLLENGSYSPFIYFQF